jgi:hypothetical protein
MCTLPHCSVTDEEASSEGSNTATFWHHLGGQLLSPPSEKPLSFAVTDGLEPKVYRVQFIDNAFELPQLDGRPTRSMLTSNGTCDFDVL